MARLFIFGLGYTAKRIKAAVEELGWQVDATGSDGNIEFGDGEAIKTALCTSSHILSSVPPDRASGVDPVLERYGAVLGTASFDTGWVGYLSSTGVYGDAKGAWIDETTATIAQTGAGRRNARAQADMTWVERGASVFSLPGIYGPGRSALDREAIDLGRKGPDDVFGRGLVCATCTGR